MTSPLLRRLTAVVAAAMLMIAGVPAVAHAAGSHHPPRPPHASPAPDRVAYVQRPTTTASFVPQRTATI